MSTTPTESVALKLLKVVIGFLMFILFARIDPSGSLGMLLAISVLCTFGVGLIFWIGIWYLLGAAAINLYTYLTKKKTTRTPIQAELQAYVIAARQAHLSDAEIRNNLVRVGWMQREIEAAFREVKN